jgi:hypothetical protein|tara:strand:+ start:644 stop:796 length:153 start_codon:yes stop_codon:yes gene_type:complete
MKNIKRSVGQKKRKAKEGFAELILSLIWGLMKWTIFLPFTIIFMLFKNKK